MGILGRLFGRRPDPEEAGRLLAAGREKLWRHDLEGARRDLSAAARGHPEPALAGAWQSLLARMTSDVHGAEETGARAVRSDESCCEAWIAWSLAALTGGDLVAALGRLGKARELAPRDIEGWFLRLLMMPLWTEAIMAATETETGVDIRLSHTPVVKAAVRILDGRADLADQEIGADFRSPLAKVARGLAAWRLGDREGAARWLRPLADDLAGTEYGPAVLALLSAGGNAVTPP